MNPYFFNGARLKLARQAKQLTQRDIAEALDVSQSTVQYWESEQGSPPAQDLYYLAKLLKTDIARFISRKKGSPSIS